MDNRKFEKLIDLIINENEEQARALFHDIVVEKSREIYENMIQDDMGMKHTFTILDRNLIDRIASMNGAEVDPESGSVETYDENTARQLTAFAKKNPQKLKSMSGLEEGMGMKHTFAILDDTLIDQIAAMDGAEVDPDAGSVETWNENTARQLIAFAKKNPERLKRTQLINTGGMKPRAQRVGGTASGPDYGLKEGMGMKHTFTILDDTLIDKIASMNGAEVDPDAGTVETYDENTARQLAAFAKKNPQRLKSTDSMMEDDMDMDDSMEDEGKKFGGQVGQLMDEIVMEE